MGRVGSTQQNCLWSGSSDVAAEDQREIEMEFKSICTWKVFGEIKRENAYSVLHYAATESAPAQEPERDPDICYS